MSVIGSNILAGASGSQGYTISRSVRLRSSASAYLSRTPASAGNRKTWTWSGWVKRGGLPSSGYYSFLGADSGAGSSFYIAFDNSTQQLEFGQGATVYRKTTQVFRDPSAWYHLVIHSDTTQATASNRLKIYVNGVQVTTFATSNDPSLNGDWALNNNVAHSIGADIPNTGARNYFDGYLTEVNFIDGQALTPSSFGENDTITGVWKPKKYAGTYGTNGFYLNFSDNSNNTATTIGKDYSGNGNNWTPNNISVTSGATYDSMLDVPTPYADGGNGRGNYCVLNPLDFSSGTVSNGNTQWATTAAVGNGCFGSFAFDIADATNKYYWEMTITSGDCVFGIVPLTTLPSNTSRPGSYSYYTNGNKYSGTSASAYGSTFTSGDVIGVAVGNGSITFYKNNVSQGSAFTGLTGFFKPAIWEVSGTFQANFGQRPFAYTPPSGFVALNTQNLPEPTIKKGNQYFDATTYTGNGVNNRAITGVGFQPDLVWTKARSAAYDALITDAVRGSGKSLTPSSTGAEVTNNGNGYVSAFNADGFTLTQGVSSIISVNESGQTYVGWQWKESATAGFDIVTYTNPASGSASFAHSLGVKPSMIITKARSGTGNWTVTHKSLGANMQDYYLLLNGTAASTTSAGIWGGEPTSSVFYSSASLQVPSATMVAYLFSEVAGFSKFGSYTGNGSSDGPFVFCGFRPRWLLVKRTNTTGDWELWDTARDTYNAAGYALLPNSSQADSYYAAVDILSNGFKLRDGSLSWNNSGSTYIFAAFSEVGFKYALGR